MLEFFLHLLITAALLLIVSNYVQGISINGWGSAFIGALLLGIVNAVVYPVMWFLTLPITIVTFGLFLLVVNALMFWLMAAISPGIRVKKFSSAFFGALLLSLLNMLVHFIID